MSPWTLADSTSVESQFQKITELETNSKTKEVLQDLLKIAKGPNPRFSDRKLSCQKMRTGKEKEIFGDTMAEKLFQMPAKTFPRKGQCIFRCYEAITTAPCIGLSKRGSELKILSVWRID